MPSTGDLSKLIKPVARSLGVLFDSNLCFEQHITKIVQSCFYQLRNISKIRSILNLSDAETLLHSFISSRLDYCNSLFVYDHITPVLASLHWLPVCFRIDFKILLITFKALHDLAPAYISELLVPYVPSHSLRSSGSRLLFLPVSRLITKGDRAFSIRAPKLWNDLPEEIRLTESLPIFKSLLKTHFYQRAYPDFIRACLCFVFLSSFCTSHVLFVLICVFIVQHFVTVFWKVLYK